jgi:hypothetical protein
VKSKYAGRHQATRRAWAPKVAAGTVTCWRCGRLIQPTEAWDLGHDDNDPSIHRGPEHAGRCNRAAGGRLGNARARHRRKQRTGRLRHMFATSPCTLAVEISQDRTKTSIGAALWVPDSPDIAFVELAAYLDGPSAGVAAVADLQARREVLSVVIDPMGGAGTLLRPFATAGVRVTECAAADVKTASAMFSDWTAGGRVRHSGQPELTTAVRHLELRRLGDAFALQRRGAVVDVAPAVAVALALWALPEDYDLLESVY